VSGAPRGRRQHRLACGRDRRVRSGAVRARRAARRARALLAGGRRARAPGLHDPLAPARRLALMLLRRCLATLLVLVTAACDEEAPPVTPTQGELPPGVVARAGEESVRIQTVERVAAAQNVAPEIARERALSDALFAAEAVRTVHPAVRRVVERGVLARAVLEEIARAAAAEGLPSDAELDAIVAERWVELDRPESARVTHAVALFPKEGGGRDEALRVARAIEAAVRDVSEPEAFISAAR